MENMFDCLLVRRNNPNIRNKYTKYELSKMVRDKLIESNLSKEDFADKYQIKIKYLDYILEAKVSFNIDIMETISKILNISIKKLCTEEFDNFPDISKESKEIQETVSLANYIFNEAVMMHKINV